MEVVINFIGHIIGDDLFAFGYSGSEIVFFFLRSYPVTVSIVVAAVVFCSDRVDNEIGIIRACEYDASVINNIAETFGSGCFVSFICFSISRHGGT